MNKETYLTLPSNYICDGQMTIFDYNNIVKSIIPSTRTKKTTKNKKSRFM